jgi:hypothetical protein
MTERDACDQQPTASNVATVRDNLTKLLGLLAQEVARRLAHKARGTDTTSRAAD